MSSRRSRRFPVPGWTLAVALALALAALALPRWAHRHEPTYLGQGPGYWFPRWTFEFAWNPADALLRSRALATAGPDALPMLAAAARIEERPSFQRYAALRRKVPPIISRFILPFYKESPAVRFDLRAVLKSMTAREPTFRAIARDWHTLPQWAREDILGWLGESTALAPIAEPLLLQVLEGTNQVLAAEAALALCRYRVAESERIDRIAAALAVLPETRVASGRPPACLDLSTRLAELGPSARNAAPLLERWLASTNPLLRGCAALALPAISPQHHPLAVTFRSRVVDDPQSPWSALLTQDRIRRTRKTVPWAELIPVVLPVLTEPTADSTTNVPSLRSDARLSRISGVLTLLDELGPEARSALPTLISTLDQDWSAGHKARVIARIGPCAPETIPSLLPALTNMDTAPSLLLLLSAYGPTSRIAAPIVRRLAEGSILLEPSPRHPFLMNDAMGGGLEQPSSVPSSNLLVAAALAEQLGYTHAWPPPAAFGRADLAWAPDQFESTLPTPGPHRTPPGTIRVPYASLDLLARHVLSLIDSDASSSPQRP